MNGAPLLRLTGIESRYGERIIHNGIDLEVKRGEILALVGGSGAGKTTLLREMILLRKPEGGEIELFGQRFGPRRTLPAREETGLRQRMGVLFQSGALFGGLNVLENVALPLSEHTHLPTPLIRQLAMLKIELTGLPHEAASLYPSELSGGMRKRAALARALALDPELLFLDEPGSGLDPVSARAIDQLVSRLRDALALTVVLVTHDLISVDLIADRVALLGDGRLLAVDTPAALREHPDRNVRAFFSHTEALA
ncbi:ABC transporter ATP-binding protein [Acidihalobacter aeolianus]|uniref:ABC transporter ATP-binding protein n=1 Tax=Acidihalobacter aeolianus TaxID=2792603 RepID=A0A1D8K8T9_9GAMM|nr:ATP-binding cassette domain-containing protein [Acidihalobacter aeolianus]AOV17378.1 ABC transporter ATP-binding protein [Acidihalobacter aeolianus]